MNGFSAHSRKGDGGQSIFQPLHEHLEQTASLARIFANVCGAGDWGYIAGLWHDIGKYSAEFQNYIRKAADLDSHIETKPGRVDHSTAGAQHAGKHKDAGKILAYVIAGHHSGLPDGISADSCLKSRLEKKVPDYSNCPTKLLTPPKLTLPFGLNPDRAGIQLSMFARMLYSSLVDADFLDTEAFMDLEKQHQRQGYKTLQELETVFLEKLSELRKAAEDTPVNRQRELVLNQCLKASEKDMGFFSLTVPTGGGKTLSSMAFALKHAAKHNLTRVIYAIPFTSIIEQNAAVFRSMLGDDAVLEHHTNFEPENEDHRSRLAAENWDAPIIVTTNVQFFESLFANRSSQCRKLHNIAESVIILDEVQALPAPYLLPCLEVMKELVFTYKTSIVLCSATQPAVQRRDDFRKGLEHVVEIIDDPNAMAQALRRTRVTVFPRTPDSELARQLAEYSQFLCVVNTRNHARNLYLSMKGDAGLYHLSALMCPVHRALVLEQVRERLRSNETCRVISTQLVEAGVDIDFPVVYRSIAGIDSIAQAAGRCNREGKLPTGEVFVFTPETGIPAGHIRQAAQAAEFAIRKHPADVLSLASIEDYFKLYYWTKGDALDEEQILSSLQAGLRKLNFPFKTVAEQFRIIKDAMKPVVIPFDGNAERLIDTLEYHAHPGAVIRKLQRYTVSVYQNQWNQLLATGNITIKAGLVPVLQDKTLYKSDLGLCVDDYLNRDPESLII